MRSLPFLVKPPSATNARIKLQEKSGDDWRNAYPVALLGPVVIPWGWILPRWMLPSPSKLNKQPDQPPEPSKKDTPRSNSSSLNVNIIPNENCMLLRRLPLELRLEIFSHVLGNDTFRLISVPWKVIAVPDVEGNLSMNQSYFEVRSLGLNMPCPGPISNDYFANPRNVPTIPGRGVALLLTCRQICQEAVELLYSTNNFVIHDFHTFETFAKSVPPQRLDAIRSLKVHWSPLASIPYQHDRTPQYDLPLDLGWFWELVVNMKSLQNLEVYLEAYCESAQNFYAASEVRRLGPLRQLRGLSNFRLELGYVSPDSGISYKSYAPAFREELMEVVRRPRES